MLGERLKDLRKSKKVTQDEVAKVLKITRGAYSHFENNRNEPSLDLLNKLADYFDVTSDYLQGRTDEKNEAYKLTDKETKDIAIEVQNMVDGMNTDAEINFYGEPMSEEDKELLAAALETALQVSKRAAKKKFTRNDYKEKKSGD